MPNSNEICGGAKNSNTSARSRSTRTASRVSKGQDTESLNRTIAELLEAFQTEKDAKNEAYYFILSNGLLDRFKDFCDKYRSRDPHKDCVDYLLSKC